MIRNSLLFVAGELARYRDVGLVPTIATFDVGSTRTVAALTDAGVLGQPVLLRIFLWGSPAIGPEPSVEALDLHLRQLPSHDDVEWIVVELGERWAADAGRPLAGADQLRARIGTKPPNLLAARSVSGAAGLSGTPCHGRAGGASGSS